MKKKLIIGLGTGRCGTVSLSKLLKQQNINASHEINILPWEFNKEMIDNALKSIINRDNDIISDVAFYYLPYVPYIIEKYPDTKFVCFKRNKQQTINSYILKFNDRNHLSHNFNNIYREDKIWDHAFPKYDQQDKKKDLTLYWDNYYKTAESYQLKYENNFKIFNMIDVLNDKKHQKQMFNFIGIKNPKIVLCIRYNTSPKH